MKIKSEQIIKPGGNYKYARAIAESTDFNVNRMIQKKRIKTNRESSNKPEGNYDYEQMIAEDADFNTRTMIEEAAYFIAQRRGFSPGNELSDWLQAETKVDGFLRNTGINRHRRVTDSRLDGVGVKS
jgi:hypothetical protein